MGSDCGVIVTASCGCAFVCLKAKHSDVKHAGPFVSRCGQHG